MKQVYLYVSLYGEMFYGTSAKSLKEKYYLPGRVSKMYIDKTDGTYEIGYVIGKQWLTRFQPVEKKVGE